MRHDTYEHGGREHAGNTPGGGSGWADAAAMQEHHIVCAAGKAHASEFRGAGLSVVFVDVGVDELRIYRDIIAGLVKIARHVVSLAVAAPADAQAGVLATALQVMGLHELTIVTRVSLRDMVLDFSVANPGCVRGVWLCDAGAACVPGSQRIAVLRTTRQAPGPLNK